ncbi:hypothetical protein AMECASPLE_009213 [Ameca splendens]|uniref:Uncharacterized protein n=2 Tax=Goodeidae TaxID=28758 RepID=A0ABV0MKA7_9TELE
MLDSMSSESPCHIPLLALASAPLSPLPHSSVFNSALSGPDGSHCLSLHQGYATSPLSRPPFFPWLCSFMTPHRFCHSAVSGTDRELPSQSLHFTEQTMGHKYEEEPLYLCLLELVFRYFPACLLGFFFCN